MIDFVVCGSEKQIGQNNRSWLKEELQLLNGAFPHSKLNEPRKNDLHHLTKSAIDVCRWRNPVHPQKTH